MEISQAIEDLKLFCDPFTEIKQKPVAGKKRLILIRNGRELTYDIDVETGKISAKHRPAAYPNIRSLLASSDFADIKRFAETQQRFFSQFKEKAVIESEINYAGSNIPAHELADHIQETPDKATLVLLDGPAGVGKTFQITQLTKAQSKRFLADNLSPPILHVTSSGRRLSNFRDVLAATTQQMAASFNGTQVPTLVRHGLLIAAIDGFDELVDADGYEDSWRALKEFIDDLKGRGKVILAARDTFLDEQELVDRISSNEEKSKISLKLAHIQLATPEKAIKYLAAESKWSPNELIHETTLDILNTNSYALRPFFLSVLKEAGGWLKINSEGFRSFLVNNLLEREAKLLARTLGAATADKLIPSLNFLFEEVSLEMATRENNLIETDHLKFLSEYCFADALDDTAQRKLTHKSGSISLLETSQLKDKRCFPHTEIQYYFLGQNLISQLSKKNIPSILRRTILSAEHLEVFAEVYSLDELATKQAMEFLYTRINMDSSNDGLATNGGAMVLLSFALGLIDRIDYLMVNDATFAGGSPEGTLNDVTLSRLDVRGSNISEVVFENVKIASLVVNDLTQFGESIPEIGMLEIRGESPVTERDPAAIEAFINQHSTSSNPQISRNNAAVHLLERIARRSIRYCYLRDGGDDDEGSFMLRDEAWPLVKRVLQSHGRLEIKKGKAMHGRPAALIRLKRPIELLDFNLQETKSIIDELVA